MPKKNPANTPTEQSPATQSAAGDNQNPFLNESPSGVVVTTTDPSVINPANTNQADLLMAFYPDTPTQSVLVQTTSIDGYCDAHVDSNGRKIKHYPISDLYAMVNEYDSDRYPFTQLLEISERLFDCFVLMTDIIYHRIQDIDDHLATYMDTDRRPYFGRLPGQINILEPEELADLEFFNQYMLPKRIGEARVVVRARYGIQLPGSGKHGSISMTLFEHTNPVDYMFSILNVVFSVRLMEISYRIRDIPVVKKPKQTNTTTSEKPATPKNKSPQQKPVEEKEEEAFHGDDESVSPPSDFDPNDVVVLTDHEMTLEVDFGQPFCVPILKVGHYKGSRGRETLKFFAPSDHSVADGKPKAHNPMLDENVTIRISLDEDSPSTKIVRNAIDAGIFEYTENKTVDCKILVTAVCYEEESQRGEAYTVFELISITSDVEF